MRTSTSASKRSATRRRSTSTSIPRPLEDGDYAVVGAGEPVGRRWRPGQDRTRWCSKSAAPTRFAGLHRKSARPVAGREKEFEVAYPEDYGSERLAGKTVKFHATVKGLRRKELPELNDEFAQDLGDYRTWTNSARPSAKASSGQRAVRGAAGGQEQDRRQAGRRPRVSRCPKSSSSGRSRTEWSRACGPWPSEGIDPRKLKLDWDKVKEVQREKAVREVQGFAVAVEDFASAEVHSRHPRRSR